MSEEERRDDSAVTMSNPMRKFTFFGSYDHSIDAKGRIIIPTAYREALGESFTVTVDSDDTAIAIYTDAGFMDMMGELYALNRRKMAVKKQLDHISKYSFPGLQADNQGRVVLPQKLRQYILGDARDVEISGALDHIRIVDRKVGEDEDAFYKEHREEILTQIEEMDD